MSERIMKALANCEQGLNNEQKLQARTNIGAIGGVKVTDASGTTELVPDEDGKVTVDLTNATQVQSDWTEADPTSKAFILHKPNLATVATTGSYDDLTDKPSIPAAQVNSDWNASSGVAEILNKPTLSAVATSGNYNDLSNKPTIPAAQVQSDWNQTDSSQVDYIKNKPAAMQTKPLVAGTNIEFVSESDRVSINTTASKVTTTSSSAYGPVTSPVTELNIDTTDLSVSADNNVEGYILSNSIEPSSSNDVGKVLTCIQHPLGDIYYGWSSISEQVGLVLGYAGYFNTFSSTATIGNNWTRMTHENYPIKLSPISQSKIFNGYYYFDLAIQMIGCCPGGPGNGKSVHIGFEPYGLNCNVETVYPNYSSTETYSDHTLYVAPSAMDLNGDIDIHFKGVFKVTGTTGSNHAVWVYVWFRTTTNLDNTFTLPAHSDAVMHACPPWYTYTVKVASNDYGRAAGSMFMM